MEIDFFVSESAYNKILSLLQGNKQGNKQQDFYSSVEGGKNSSCSSVDCCSAVDCEEDEQSKQNEEFDGYILGDGSLDGGVDSGIDSNIDGCVDGSFDGNYDFLLSNNVSNNEHEPDASKSTMQQNEKSEVSAESVGSQNMAEKSKNSSGSEESEDSEGEATSSDNPFFKISVIGGGCAGFSYDFSIVNQKSENDVEIPIATEDNEINLLIDGMSVHLLSGCYLDYEVSLVGSKFKLENPNACANCSCGSSFGI